MRRSKEDLGVEVEGAQVPAKADLREELLRLWRSDDEPSPGRRSAGKRWSYSFFTDDLTGGLYAMFS